MSGDAVTVGWDAGLEWPGLPPLADDVTADVCVVGLGASGLAAVEAARERGLTVVGLDAGRVAGGAAGRNGGFLLGGPAPFLHDALARWGEPAVALYRATLAELDRLAELLPGAVRRTGSIRLAGWPGAPDPDEAADCATHAAALREHSIAVEDYDGPLGTGIYLPDDAAMNPAARAFALARRAADAGAVLREHSPVTGVVPGRVTTDAGAVSCGAVVVAVDGRLPAVLPALAHRVRTARLQMLATGPVPPVLECPLYGRWGYDYVQQDPSGRVFAGGGRDRHEAAEWTDSAEPSVPVQAHVEAAVRALGVTASVTHRWAASVGFTGDGRALCVEVAPGVVGVGGYSGTGNLVGPVAARAGLARAVDGTAPPAYLAS